MLSCDIYEAPEIYVLYFTLLYFTFLYDDLKIDRSKSWSRSLNILPSRSRPEPEPHKYDAAPQHLFR
jgi:hypothetical protein